MSKCKQATKAELAWCERLRKVLAAHPPKLWLFAGDGVLYAMKYPEDGAIASYSSEITADGGGW